MINVRDNRKKALFANKMHKGIFFFVFAAALVPAIIVTILLYYLIFQITAQEIGMPDVIAQHIMPAAQKVLAILFIAIPIIVAILLFFAYRITHQIIGPFDRIVRELDECLAGTKHGHIIIRKSDKFWPLVHKINELLDKLEQK
jgi:heme/copper-type cytochrome/quinol oxidase subunit 2